MFKCLQEPRLQNMSLIALSILLIVGLATAELGQKGYSPKYNIKTYGNPFGSVVYNNIGIGGLGEFESYYGNGYPIYGGHEKMYGNGIFNLAGPYKGYGGIGIHGGYPGYGYHNGLGYHSLNNFGGYDMGNFGGLDSMSSLAGYSAIGFGMGGYGGYGMGSYEGYGMGGYGGYGIGGYSGHGYGKFGKVFGKNIFVSEYSYLSFLEMFRKKALIAY